MKPTPPPVSRKNPRSTARICCTLGPSSLATSLLSVSPPPVSAPSSCAKAEGIGAMSRARAVIREVFCTTCARSRQPKIGSTSRPPETYAVGPSSPDQLGDHLELFGAGATEEIEENGLRRRDRRARLLHERESDRVVVACARRDAIGQHVHAETGVHQIAN